MLIWLCKTRGVWLKHYPSRERAAFLSEAAGYEPLWSLIYERAKSRMDFGSVLSYSIESPSKLYTPDTM